MKTTKYCLVLLLEVVVLSLLCWHLQVIDDAYRGPRGLMWSLIDAEIQYWTPRKCRFCNGTAVCDGEACSFCGATGRE